MRSKPENKTDVPDKDNRNIFKRIDGTKYIIDYNEDISEF